MSRQVITAGKADETVADGGGPAGKNSIFTRYLIEGLSGAACDAGGVLTANMLMNFVYAKVGQDARSQQTPHYGHIEGDGDFILRTPDDEHLTESDSADYLVETLAEVPEAVLPVSLTRTEPDFALELGYGNPKHPNFGRNDLSARLGAHAHREDWTIDYSRAFSWLAMVVEPVHPVTINLTDWIGRRPLERKSDSKPLDQFHLFLRTMTRIDSAIFYNENGNKNEFLGNYLRVNKEGNLEYADSHISFYENNDIRCFGYVSLIGLAWQFLFLAKRILGDVGFKGGVRFLFNLIGTHDTILSDFATEPGENGMRWEQPVASHMYGIRNRRLTMTCQDLNLKMPYDLTLHNLTEENSFAVIRNIAEQLALAYNHQSSPRCFNPNTDVFPWNQYLTNIHRAGG